MYGGGAQCVRERERESLKRGMFTFDVLVVLVVVVTVVVDEASDRAAVHLIYGANAKWRAPSRKLGI